MKYFTLIICILAFSNLAFSQTKEVEKFETEITVCPVKLLNGTANFRSSYRYIIKTNDKGEVEKIDQLGKNDVPKFIKDEDFIPCIKSWKLNPSEEYSVMFSLGTNYFRGGNYISISSKTERIKVNLGTEIFESIIEDKK